MRIVRYKVKCKYNGSSFYGWAAQPGLLTIEGNIQDCLSKIYDRNIKIHGSGRTDRGVHAQSQIFHFDAPQTISTKNLKYKLNRLLNDNIYIVEVKVSDNQFHARLSAKKKVYEYIINEGDKDIWNFDSKFQYNQKLPIHKLRIAATLFKGEHDFASFSTSTLNSTMRIIYYVRIKRKNKHIFIKVCGSGFLKNQVRMIVGNMLLYATDKRSLQEIRFLLTNPKKGTARSVAPPEGLYLKKVYY